MSVECNDSFFVSGTDAIWLAPVPHAWPKTDVWSNAEIIEAIDAFNNTVRELGRMDLPQFNAVDLIREERSKND
jgi:hypothetical protein